MNNLGDPTFVTTTTTTTTAAAAAATAATTARAPQQPAAPLAHDDDKELHKGTHHSVAQGKVAEAAVARPPRLYPTTM